MTAYAMTSPLGDGVTRRRVVSVRAVPTAVGRARRLGLLVTLVTAALVGLYAPGAFAGAEPAAAGSFDTYTVAQGETLWSIATGLTVPGEDVGDTVSRLQTLNAMGDSSLRAGEQILIPALEG